MRMSASSIASTAPIATELKASFKVSGTPSMSLTKVSAMKARSTLSSPPQAAHGIILGALEAPGRDGGDQEIEPRRRDVERERLVGGAAPDCRLAQELDEPRDRDQRRLLQDELPDVAEARNCVAQHLRSDDAPEQEHGVHADGFRG